MLWEEMEKYTKLTGEDATYVPIMKIGAYLDGYEKGTEVLNKIRAEINTMPCAITSMKEVYVNRDKVISIFDKYKAESEVEDGKID